MADLTDLPVELLHSIFEHLEDLVDLFSCALVCRTLYSAVKAYRAREVAFTRRIHKWFHLDISIYKHRVNFSMVSLLKGSSFSLEFLKRLKIGRRSSIDDLNVINKFIHLEDLDIDLKNYENWLRRTLSLTNLKVLRLFMSEHSPYLKLDTPKLAKVCTFSLEKLDFLYPDSIRCIRTFFHSGKLSIFSNLEYLTVTDLYNQLDYFESYLSQSFNAFSLASLKKLKEIEFFFCVFKYEDNNLDKIQKAIATILTLERPDMKVFWRNMQVIDSNLLTEYKEAMENRECPIGFQLQRYEMLKDKVDFCWVYNFNVSMNLLPKAGFDLRSEEFTSKFFAKHSFWEIGLANELKEEELLLKLIARSPRLSGLRFWNTNLSQSFFDRMANTIRLNGIHLRQIRFKNISNESLLRSLEFVSTIHHLEFFKTDQPLSAEYISKLFALPLLTAIKSGRYWIERLSTNRFLLNEKPLSLQELLLTEFEAEP